MEVLLLYSDQLFPILRIWQVGLGNRMDLVFLNIRIGLFHNDHTITTANIAKAKQMLEEGGDWDRRNRLKVEIETMQPWLGLFSNNLQLLKIFTLTSSGVRGFVRHVREGLQAVCEALPRRHLHFHKVSEE